MAERDRFELDLGSALRVYAEEAPTRTHPAELARQLAEAHPRGRTAAGSWRLGSSLRLAWLVLLVAGLLAAMVGGGLLAGSRLRPALPAIVPPGVGDGQTVSVTVSGVSGHSGDDLAVVLYGGGELTDLDRDALGGFWSVISGDDFTTTEVVRKLGDLGVGRFPFVSDQALTVAPGRYTLVVWVDDALSPASRWVPINTDGQGLFGCQMVFEVGADAQTGVAVTANLQPDGWNVDCATP